MSEAIPTHTEAQHAASAPWTAGATAIRAALAGAAIGLAILAIWAAYSWPLDARSIARYPLDAVYLLVAAEAIQAGQSLHQDQLTPIGALAFYPVALARQWLDTAAAAFNFLVVSSAVSVFVLSLMVAWKRLSVISACALMVMNLLVVLLPVHLGDYYHDFTIAMHYNKWSFAVLSIAFLASFWPLSRSQWTLDATISILCLLLLFYIKITFFLVALAAAALALALPLRERRARRMLGATLALLAAILVVLPMNWTYLADIYQSGLASDRVGLGPHRILGLIRGNYDLLFVVAASYALLLAVIGRTRVDHYPLWAAGAIMLGGSLAALSQNGQTSGMPSLIALLIVLFELARQGSAGIAQPERRRGAALASALVLLLYPCTMALESYLALHKYRLAGDHFVAPPGADAEGPLSGIRVDAQTLAPGHRWMSLPNAGDVQRAVFYDDDIYEKSPGGYFASLGDAGALAASHDGRSLRVWTADIVNGPAILEGFSPAPGWYLWTHATFAPLAPEAVFGDVDAVMLPHFPAGLAVRERMLEVYGEAISSRFVITAQSRHWTLCVAPDDPLATPAPAGGHRPCRLPRDPGALGSAALSR